MVRLRGRQLAPAREPGPHAHGPEAGLTAGRHIQGSVAYDEYPVGAHRAPMAVDQFSGPPHRRLQQGGSVKRVRSEPPEGEVLVEPRGLQLDAGPPLDIPRSQAQEHPLLPAQAPQERSYPGTEPVAALPHGSAHLPRKQAQVLAVHPVDLPASGRAPRGGEHGLVEVAQVGFARQAQLPAHAAPSVQSADREVERPAPRPARAHQGPVHVEEQDHHPRRGGVFHGVPCTSLPFFHTALVRFAPNQ